MCECDVYLDKDGKQEKIMEKVASIKVKEGRLHLVDLWGETKDIEAQLKELLLLDNRILWEKKPQILGVDEYA